jgi:hypothetical protein
MSFHDVTTEFNPETLKIKPLFDEFDALMDVEDAALKRIDKSGLTARIAAADKLRDTVFRGLTLTCRGATMLPRHEVNEPAAAIMIVLDTYGNIAKKPMAEKASAFVNLVQELRKNYADAVEAVGLEEWVDELTAANAHCFQLAQERLGETSQHAATVSMRAARTDVDAAYAALMKRALALQEVGGEEIYDRYFARISALVVATRTAAAHHARRSGKPKDDAEK